MIRWSVESRKLSETRAVDRRRYERPPNRRASADPPAAAPAALARAKAPTVTAVFPRARRGQLANRSFRPFSANRRAAGDPPAVPTADLRSARSSSCLAPAGPGRAAPGGGIRPGRGSPPGGRVHPPPRSRRTLAAVARARAPTATPVFPSRARAETADVGRACSD